LLIDVFHRRRGRPAESRCRTNFDNDRRCTGFNGARHRQTPKADPNSKADAKADANANANADTDTDTDTNTNADADPNADTDPNTGTTADTADTAAGGPHADSDF
jgi:hypothetical protein